LRGESLLAVDTEFVREFTYSPVLELVQVATPRTIALIDCRMIGAPALGPLLSVLSDPGTLKIFHDARSDLEILHTAAGVLAGPVWDTQLAPGFFGYDGPAGYAGMVRALLGQSTPDGQARTDWSRRPLSAAQIEYAAADVQFLIPLCLLQRQRLGELNRLEWAREECERLRIETAQNSDKRAEENLAGGRVKGVRRFDARGLAIVQALAKWRDAEARRRNKPRAAVLRDDMLVEIARRAPRSLHDLRELRGLRPGDLERAGSEIVAAVKRGLALPGSECPVPEDTGPVLSAGQSALVALLSALIQTIAEKRNISPALIATTGDLQRLVVDYAHGTPEALPVLSGWRGELVRTELLGILRGTRTVAWDPLAGDLTIEQRIP
jgi:ribonuclease D